MPRSAKSWTAIIAGLVAVFAALILILLRIMPGPHTHTDYMVVGTIATLLALVVLFVVLIGASSGNFFRRRQR